MYGPTERDGDNRPPSGGTFSPILRFRLPVYLAMTRTSHLSLKGVISSSTCIHQVDAETSAPAALKQGTRRETAGRKATAYSLESGPWSWGRQIVIDLMVRLGKVRNMRDRFHAAVGETRPPALVAGADAPPPAFHRDGSPSTAASLGALPAHSRMHRRME